MAIAKIRPGPVYISAKESILYPESDGEPMAYNTRQFDEITTTKWNLELRYVDDPNVFVAGDLFWYPVEGEPKIRQAPDVMVAFGRPKGYRGAYLQWREDNVAPQVVFEILSPGNRKGEMDDKFGFYERYGVEEYYFYDPDRGHLNGWLRNAWGRLTPIPEMHGWRSPRLGIRFELEGNDWRLYYPDGKPFFTLIEAYDRLRQAELRAAVAMDRADAALENYYSALDRVEEESRRAEQEAQRAEQEAQRAEQEAQRAEQEAQRAAEAEARVRELETMLRAAGLA